MKNFKSISILLLSFVLFSSNAYAWGDREQGIVTGAVGALIVDRIISNDRRNDSYERRTYESRGYITREEELRRAYERGVRERERREFNRMKQEAYKCGFNGDCNYR